MRLGLLAPRQASWAAGTIYLHNLIGSLSLLPDREKLSIYLFLGSKSRSKSFSLLDDLKPPFYFYSHRKNYSWWKKLAGSWLNIAKQKKPISLERLINVTQTSALFPSNFPSKPSSSVSYISWIPDLQHIRHPHFFSEEERAKRNILYRKYIESSNHLVVSSQDAFRDLNRSFPIDSQKVSVIPFAAYPFSSWYHDEPIDMVIKYRLPSKFLIFPSQFWIHKNHRCIFEAVQKLRDSGLKDIVLVCTGYTHDYRHPYYFKELKQLIKMQHLHDHIYILGLLPRVKQIQLIRRSVAVVQCSLHEGWSTIVEDAVALGKKIYLSDIPVHREQDPPKAQFFNPEDVESLAEMIRTDWANLEPGPDLNQEELARKKQKVRALCFAQNFQTMLKKAVKK